MLVGICCEPLVAAHGHPEDGLRPSPVGPMNGLYAKRIPMGDPKGDILGENERGIHREIYREIYRG